MRAFDYILVFLIALVAGFIGSAIFNLCKAASDEDYVKTSTLNDRQILAMFESENDMIKNIHEMIDNCIESLTILVENENDMQRHIEEHYRWSLGIWNDIANAKMAMEHPMPHDMNNILAQDVIKLDDVRAMGPRE